MQIFKTLSSLTAKGVRVEFHVSDAGNGKLEVAIYPTCASGDSGLNLVAKSFVGPPEDLDAELPRILAAYCQANATLADQLSAIQAEADAIAEKARVSAKAKPPTVSNAAKSVVPQRQPNMTGGVADVKVKGVDDEDEEDTGTGQGGGEVTSPNAATAPEQAQISFTL